MGDPARSASDQGRHDGLAQLVDDARAEELTEERRKEYVKLVKSKAEEHKVSVRNARRKAKDAMDKAVKDGEVGEDEGARGEKDLDAMTKKHVDLIEEMAKNKEQELLEV